MPKRIVDGEALWLSDKLKLVPEKFRAEVANLIPLASSNGSFECNPHKIWVRVYAYNRPDVTVEFVEEMLEAFPRAKMLFRWQDEGGVTWGYWVGIDKPGRLPSGTNKKHGAKGAEVPREVLQSFLSKGFAPEPVKDQSSTGQIPVNDRSGFGYGLGSGKTTSSEVGPSDKQYSEPLPSREPSAEAVKLAHLLREKIARNNPQARLTTNQERKWALEADRMIARDGRTPAAIHEIIEFSQADTFWRANILSMGKLREKFDQLWLKRSRPASRTTPVLPISRNESEIPILEAE